MGLKDDRDSGRAHRSQAGRRAGRFDQDGAYSQIPDETADDYGYASYARGGLRSSDAAGGYRSSDVAVSAYADAEDEASARRAAAAERVARRRAAAEDAAARERAADDASAYSRSAYGTDGGYESFLDRDERRYGARYSNRAGEDPRSARRQPATSRGYDGAEAEPSAGQAAPRNARASYVREHVEDAGEAEGQPQVSRTRASYGRGGEAYAAKRSNRKRNVIIAVVAVLAVLGIGAGIAFAYVNGIMGNLNEGVDQDLKDALVETDMANEPFYMLLLGTDKSEWRDDTGELDGVYRTDSMMLARIDAPHGKATLVSIPRDTLVNLGEHGWQKINSAYAFGGPSLAVEAVSNLAGVKISHYAEIDFDGFEAMVDTLGGVEVDVPVPIDDWKAGGSLDAGLQTLSGEEALILCRTRETFADTATAPDLIRAANQRLVLSAIAHKLVASDIATIANTVRVVSEYVTTDLQLNDIIGLAQAMQGLEPDDDIYTTQFPTQSVYIANGYVWADAYAQQPIEPAEPGIDDGYYMLADSDAWKKMEKRMSEGLPPTEGSEIDEATGIAISTAGADAIDISVKNCWITVANGTDREGLGSRAAGLLNAAGFENIEVHNAIGSDYPETLVVYNEDGRAHEADVIVSALGQGRAMKNDGNYLIEGDFLVVIGDDWQTGV